MVACHASPSQLLSHRCRQEATTPRMPLHAHRHHKSFILCSNLGFHGGAARKRKDLSFFTQPKPFYPFGAGLAVGCSSICSNFYDSSTKAPWLIEHNSSDTRKRLNIGLFKLSWVTAAPGCPPPPSSQYRSSKNPREGHFLSPDPQHV